MYQPKEQRMTNHRYRHTGLLALTALTLTFGVGACSKDKAADTTTAAAADTTAAPAADTTAAPAAAAETTAAPAAAAETTTAAAAAETTAAAAAETVAAPANTVAVGAVEGLKLDSALHDALPAAMKKSGVMTLATDPTDPPLEFYNDKNELVGAEVDLAAALGVILGVDVKLVPSKFDAIIPGIQAGRFDGSVSGFADRVERAKVVDFVDYFTSSRGYLIKTGTMPDAATRTDLCGLKVAVAKGTTMADAIDGLNATCKTDGKKAIDGQIYPDQSACVLAVQSGRADLTILSDHAALWIAKASNGELDVALRPTEGNDINGIVLAKGELTAPVQKAVQQLMDSGKFKEIFTRWNLQKLILTKATVNAGTN
jgi:polar amino acid transport system substrate-binding protein